jgi:hypothetical protein
MLCIQFWVGTNDFCLARPQHPRLGSLETHNRDKHMSHNQNLYIAHAKPSHLILTWPGCLSDHQGIASHARPAPCTPSASRARRRHSHEVVDGTIYARVS